MTSSVFRINELLEHSQWQSSVGVFESGRFITVWHDNSGEYTSSADGDAVVGRMFDYDGAPLTDTFQINVGTYVDSSTYPSIAVSTELPYQMLAVWEQPDSPEYGDGDGLGIFGQIIDSSGDLHATPFQINSFVAGDQVHPKVTALEDGNFVVSWFEDNGAAHSFLIAQRVSASGTLLGNEIIVSSEDVNTINYDVTSLTGGGFAVIWNCTESNLRDLNAYDTRLNLYDSNGQVLNALPHIVDLNPLNVSFTNSITELSNGQILVSNTTTDMTDFVYFLEGQILESDGTETGQTFTIKDETGVYNAYHTVEALNDGGFIVAWRSGIGQGRADIYYQRYDSLAREVGPNVLVAEMPSDQATPTPLEIIVNEENGFFIIYDDYSEYEGDISSRNISGRYYPPEDTILSDVISGSNYDDVLVADLGGDRIIGEGGNDTIIAGTASDSILGGDGSDVISAEDGNNLVSGGNGDDLITTGAGADAIDAGAGSDRVEAGDGDDTIYGSSGENTIIAGDGNDSVVGGTDNDVISGGDGNDALSGGASDDRISGSSGNDTIHGNEGDDLIGGGLGDDEVYGDEGNDTIGSGTGNDTVTAGDGNDLIAAGRGDDILLGGEGDDRLAGSVGSDTIEGHDGNDNIGGGYHNDRILAGSGNDTVGAGQQDDFVHGMIGDDILNGNAGHDTLVGGDGNDTISGGDHNDLMMGGTGADVFKFRVFNTNTEDRITDFTRGEDLLEMRGSFAGLNISNHADGIQIEKNGHVIILEDVANLSADDFIFV